MARSAPEEPVVATDVTSVSVLLAGLGSAVAALTTAVLLSRPEAGAVAVIVMTGAVATARLVRVQVRTPATGTPQVHPPPDAVTLVRPAGRVSATLTETAVAGPALATVRV